MKDRSDKLHLPTDEQLDALQTVSALRSVAKVLRDELQSIADLTHVGYTSFADKELMPIKDSAVISFHPLIIRKPRDKYVLPVYVGPEEKI